MLRYPPPLPSFASRSHQLLARVSRGKERDRPLRVNREATEWANPTAIATLIWPLFGIGRPGRLRLLTAFPAAISAVCILGFPSTEDGSDYEVTRVTEKIVEDKGKWALPENQDEVDDEKESEDNINSGEDEFHMNRKVNRHRALCVDDVKPTKVAISANWRSL
ncbi:uncharacterized protein A4U43_C03F22280 [Asparagus officinalis]|uniref:Uncharacterized protein n=1 Tax=Asparagus officinalis TaxID=4686 RepID=A0A5P1FH24_ASPOF|nr:uncharacterized protein A4U43_C03F22280 [Asparagus officinalis]